MRNITLRHERGHKRRAILWMKQPNQEIWDGSLLNARKTRVLPLIGMLSHSVLPSIEISPCSCPINLGPPHAWLYAI
jgi:hypothetical protein